MSKLRVSLTILVALVTQGHEARPYMSFAKMRSAVHQRRLTRPTRTGELMTSAPKRASCQPHGPDSGRSRQLPTLEMAR
jgi:hypothetical protein